jgi:hypothetical protein
MQNHRVICIWKVCEFHQSKDFCFLEAEFTTNYFYGVFIKKLSIFHFILNSSKDGPHC